MDLLAIVVALLCLTTLWLGVLAYRHLGQIGRQRRRIEALERQIRALDELTLPTTPDVPLLLPTGSHGAEPVSAAADGQPTEQRRPPMIPPGTAVFEFELADLDGRQTLRSEFLGQRLLLIFVKPSCPHSRAVLTALAALRMHPAESWPTPVVVSTGDRDANRELVERAGYYETVLLQSDMEVADRLGVSAVPMAVLIDKHGRTVTTPAAGTSEILGLAAPSPRPAASQADYCPADQTAPVVASLASVIATAFERPAELTRDSVDRCVRALEEAAELPGVHAAALAALAAIIYARPTLLKRDAVRRLFGTLESTALPVATYRRAGRVLGFLACTPAAPDAADLILRLLGQPDLSPALYGALLDGLEQLQTWGTGLDLDRVVELTGHEHLVAFRTRLLNDVIEPTLLASPGSVKIAHLDDLAAWYERDCAFPYLLAFVADQRDTSPDVRAVAQAGLGRHFPLRDDIALRLRAPGARVLLVQNIADGQRDEIVRVVPLLQALLAANPDLHVTLVTARPYLYGHIRLVLVPFDDAARLAHVLSDRFDAVIDCCDATHPAGNHSLDVARRVHDDAGQQPPISIGSTTGRAGFVYERVNLDGHAYSEALGLDRRRVPSVYEATYRLLAQLGLPIRLGGDPPGQSSVLGGLPSQAAAERWATLYDANTDGRPVALFNPFGELASLNGFVPATFDHLTARLHALVTEGYFVIVLPSGTPWGRAASVEQVLARLEPADRRWVVSGPDPYNDGALAACEGLGDLLVPGGDANMRLIIAFAGYADLVVSVDGWLIHAASLLGKPFRMLKLPLSGPAAWHPYGRAQSQRIDPGLPPAVEPGASLLATAPLPDFPRKDILRFIMREIGPLGDLRLRPILEWASSSDDPDVRRAATDALGCMLKPA